MTMLFCQRRFGVPVPTGRRSNAAGDMVGRSDSTAAEADVRETGYDRLSLSEAARPVIKSRRSSRSVCRVELSFFAVPPQRPPHVAEAHHRGSAASLCMRPAARHAA